MASSHDQKFKHYLKQWREKRGMLQSDLAKEVGCATSVISRYETGDRRIHLEMQFKLMQALGIWPAQFFAPPPADERDDIYARLGAATPEERRRIGIAVKALLGGDDPG